jgi:hypothetical protein
VCEGGVVVVASLASSKRGHLQSLPSLAVNASSALLLLTDAVNVWCRVFLGQRRGTPNVWRRVGHQPGRHVLRCAAA